MHEVTKTEPTRVRVTLGMKVNMGNYETLNIEFAVEDSARSGETAPQLTERVYSFVEKKLIEKVTEVREGGGEAATVS